MRTRTRTILAGLVLAAALVGGVAWATIPGADGAIQGCYTTGNGNLRVVDSPDMCRNSETAISWNQQGPTGAAGANGADGPAGPQGAKGDNGSDGAAGPQGAKGDTGAAGPAGAAGAPGTNGTNGVTGAPCLATDPACVGPKGDTGAAGTNGTNGRDGANGAPCLPEIRGCEGPQGDMGATGPQGPQGEPGAKGDPGTAGSIDIQNLLVTRAAAGDAWQQTANPYFWTATLQADCPTGYKALDGSVAWGVETLVVATALTADLSGLTVVVKVGTSPIATPPTYSFGLKLRCIGVI